MKSANMTPFTPSLSLFSVRLNEEPLTSRSMSENEKDVDTGNGTSSEEVDGSSSMVSSSDEDEEATVLVKEAGRIVYGGRMEFKPRSFTDILQFEPNVIEKLRSDAVRVCRTQAMDYGEVGRSRGETFFIGANEKPRCALEQMAQEIFFFHARDTTHDFNLSGAE